MDVAVDIYIFNGAFSETRSKLKLGSTDYEHKEAFICFFFGGGNKTNKVRTQNY